ncbi:MAG: hypothetical protein ACYTFA_04680, partial [Planctomycetota bacterium]
SDLDLTPPAIVKEEFGDSPPIEHRGGSVWFAEFPSDLAPRLKVHRSSSRELVFDGGHSALLNKISAWRRQFAQRTADLIQESPGLIRG